MLNEEEILKSFAVLREQVAELEYNRRAKWTNTVVRVWSQAGETDREKFLKLADETLMIFENYAKRIIAGHELDHKNH